ncbi:MAG: hypothetical protein ACYTEQ_09435 [Planctomycetota bacterium]|jgi:hypothetical protein
MITRTIATHKITLTPGKRYRASRRIADPMTKVFYVTIVELDQDRQPVAAVIAGLTLPQANALINEFNNGPTSFTGRVWL